MGLYCQIIGIPMGINCTQLIVDLLLAHLAQSAKVSFWDDPLSVVRRRASCVVRRQQFYLNIFFSETTDDKVIKVGTDVSYDILFINC